MIRPATAADQPSLEALIRRQHAASTYAGLVDISEKVMRGQLAGLIAMQRQSSVGATHFAVAERERKVVGFLAGILNRIYFIGNKLEAGDIYFVNEGTIGDTLGLVDSYIAWATANRQVLDIKLSWTDAIPGAEKIVGLFARKGFAKCGEVWKIRKGGE